MATIIAFPGTTLALPRNRRLRFRAGMIRSVIVAGCALALIAAGQPLPF